MQLERILRSQGFGSRASTRALVLSGRVRIEGECCGDPLRDIDPEGLRFEVDGTPWVFRKQAYLMLNKPTNYECSRKPDYYPSVYSLLPEPLVNRGTQAVGRLDADTTGILLLTDDGQFIHTFTSPKKEVRKTYEIGTRHPVDTRQLEALIAGVVLHDDPRPVRAVACERLGECKFSMAVTEGKYHMVKRMVAAVGNRVETLHRVSVGELHLPDDLEPGAWRWLEEDHLQQLGWH